METKLLTPATWPDFEDLFARHGGLHGGCWCTYHRMSMSEFIKSSRESRYALSKELVLSGKATGLLLYDAGVAIGWCQFGPAAGFPAFDRMRDYKALAIPPRLAPSWRITCFVVDKDHRRLGLSKTLLDATLTAIAAQGGGVVEAFPLVLPGDDKPQYTGTLRAYLAVGFEAVAPIGKYNRLVRKEILP